MSTETHTGDRWPSMLPEPEPLVFGRHLGPFAVVAEHQEGEGWSAPEVLPRAAMRIDIATGALQYGVSVFDGLKAYRDADGAPWLFRAREHAQRLQQSALRLSMPEPSQDLLLRMLMRAVDVHRDWLPPHSRGALYLRPTLLACEEMLGLRRATRHLLTIIVTPCSVPASASKRLWAERDFIRAAPGGLGAAKTGANYAASLYAAQLARERGFDDALWLDAHERRYLGEAGTMNVFVALRDRVLTPPLDGTILAGITRDSLLCLLRADGRCIEERPIALDELQGWQHSGELREVFGAGTAARIVPIVEIAWKEGSVTPAGGELAAWLARQLGDLHDGVADDVFGWRMPVATCAGAGLMPAEASRRYPSP